MKASFFLFLSFLLIIIQTTVLPETRFFNCLFDLIIIIILYISLAFTHPGTIFLVIFLGILMDSISGSPFGFYISSYLWIYIAVKVLKQFVFPTSIIVLPLIAVLSLAIEHLFLIMTVFIINGKESVMALNFSLMAKQLIWAFFIMPPMVWFVFTCQKKYEQILTRIVEKNQ